MKIKATKCNQIIKKNNDNWKNIKSYRSLTSGGDEESRPSLARVVEQYPTSLCGNDDAAYVLTL